MDLQRGHILFISDIPHQDGVLFSREGLPPPIFIETPKLPENYLICLYEKPINGLYYKSNVTAKERRQGIDII